MKKTIVVIAVVAGVAFIAFLVMPAIRQDSGKPRRVQDMNNLHQIGLACQMFAREHEGRFPDDLSQLTPYFGPDATSCFISASKRGSEPGAMTNIMQWTDYIYLRGATTSSSPSTVVAFLPIGIYPAEQGTLVLLADGRVRCQTLSEFTRAMNSSPNNTSEAIRHPADGAPNASR